VHLPAARFDQMELILNVEQSFGLGKCLSSQLTDFFLKTVIGMVNKQDLENEK
jgi:ethanolamine utilization protein EutP (predicted NTPase)